MLVEIKFRGIDMLLKGEYTPKNQREFLILKVKIEDLNVTDFFEEHMEELELLALEKINQ